MLESATAVTDWLRSLGVLTSCAPSSSTAYPKGEVVHGVYLPSGVAEVVDRFAIGGMTDNAASCVLSPQATASNVAAAAATVATAQPPRGSSTPGAPSSQLPASPPPSLRRQLQQLQAAHLQQLKAAHLKQLQAKVKRSVSRTQSDPVRSLRPHGYTPLGPIAAGAFSTILRCRHDGSGAHVAVKSFDSAKCDRNPSLKGQRDNEMQVLRLLRSTALGAKREGDDGGGGVQLPWAAGTGSGPAAGDGHPHIANMLEELGDAASCAHTFAVLEFCECGSLKRYLQGLLKAVPSGVAALQAHVPGMAPEVVAEGTLQLASALAHLHALGIAHGDIKPANILLTGGCVDGKGVLDGRRLQMKICDFGFSCICGDRKLRDYCATPCYAPPELATPTDAHKGYYGRPVDMWALGCVIYEMLHGGREHHRGSSNARLPHSDWPMRPTL